MQFVNKKQSSLFLVFINIFLSLQRILMKLRSITKKHY